MGHRTVARACALSLAAITCEGKRGNEYYIHQLHCDSRSTQIYVCRPVISLPTNSEPQNYVGTATIEKWKLLQPTRWQGHKQSKASKNKKDIYIYDRFRSPFSQMETTATTQMARTQVKQSTMRRR